MTSAAQRASQEQTPSGGDGERHIGRGGIYLTLTKLYFIASSYVIYFLLPRVGPRGLLGDYKAVNALLGVISPVLVTGTLQAVSRHVGRAPRLARAVKARSLRLQVVVGGVAAGIFLLVAPRLVSDEPSFEAAARVAAAIPMIYALHAVFMGTLNGQRRFGEQALLDGAFTTLKITLVVGGALVAGGVVGAFAGFACAALAVMLCGAVLVRRGQEHLPATSPDVPGTGRMLAFQLQTVGFMVLVQWVVQMDIWYVDWLTDHPPAVMKQVRDVYGTSQLMASVAYALVVSVTFVLFPLISGLDPAAGRRRARGYVREALRYALLMVVPVAAILSSTPRASLGLILDDLAAYDPAQLAHAEALRWLGPGFVFLALLFILCSVLNASGRPRLSVAAMAGVLVLQAAGGALLVPVLGPTGQGVAGLVATAAGLCGVVLLVRALTGPFLPWATIARVLAGAAAVYAIALAWPTAGLLPSLVRFAIEAAVFLAVILVLGEIGPADRERIGRVLRRGRGP